MKDKPLSKRFISRENLKIFHLFELMKKIGFDLRYTYAISGVVLYYCFQHFHNFFVFVICIENLISLSLSFDRYRIYINT